MDREHLACRVVCCLGVLVNEYGPEIVTPPQAPIILISADQSSARLLPNGLKDADELKAEIAKGR